MSAGVPGWGGRRRAYAAGARRRTPLPSPDGRGEEGPWPSEAGAAPPSTKGEQEPRGSNVSPPVPWRSRSRPTAAVDGASAPTAVSAPRSDLRPAEEPRGGATGPALPRRASRARRGREAREPRPRPPPRLPPPRLGLSVLARARRARPGNRPAHPRGPRRPRPPPPTRPGPRRRLGGPGGASTAWSAGFKDSSTSPSSS